MGTVITKNWVTGNCPTMLNQIHNREVNIAIYNRDISSLSNEIDKIQEQNIEIRLSGNIREVTQSLRLNLSPFTLLLNDIKYLLNLFGEISHAKSFRLLMATVNTNMCRRFHTDVNDLRLLCTYFGPGTLWLKEENVNRTALETCKDNECIVLNPDEIQQAPTGAVVILKGSIYPSEETKAIVHRSPTIDKSGEKRLLLRIDTNEFLNFL